MEASDFPYPGMRVVATPHGFGDLVKRLDAAIEANGMFAVTRASASVGAKRRGVDIPGNMVVGVFAPYGSAELDAMAQELDAIFAAIGAGAARPD
jgi:uncharacterized protein (DUF302 family)